MNVQSPIERVKMILTYSHVQCKVNGNKIKYLRLSRKAVDNEVQS